MESENTHHLSTNLKHLRLLRKTTQDQTAFSLGLKRSSYSGYENATAEPTLAALVRMGTYHRLSLDLLVPKDLRHLRPSEIEQLQREY